MRWPALLVILGLVLAGPALAQPRAGDAAEGATLAATWCAQCHRVAAAGPGPVADAVPAFATLAARPGVTAAGLAGFLLTPHPGMPDYRLTPTQIADLAAFILSQRP
jgi:mono/diheme cytochrome c family protein